MIHVIAMITTKPGMRDAVMEALRANVPAVRAEHGCIEYGGAVDLETGLAVQRPLGPDCIIVLEKWETVEALKDHATAPHMLAYAAKTKEMILGRTIHILSPV